MSKRSRRYPKAAAIAAPAIVSPSAAMPGGSVWSSSIFDGANFSTRRGYVYVPTLDTRREVDTLSRLELTRRARWLTRNVGFARRCRNGVAGMVGSLMPRPLTTSREWNKAALARWEAVAGSAETFDLAGRFNVYNYQPALTRSALGDGDVLSVFTTKHGGAAVMTYESHQVSQGSRPQGRNGWFDGVKCDRANAAVAFSVVDDFETGKTVEIPAAACVLHANFEAFGRRREVTGFAHAVNNLLDTTEIVSDLKLAVKNSSKLGIWEYTAPGSTSGTVPGLPDAIAAARAKATGGNLRTETASDGKKLLVEDIYRGGQLRGLDPGKELRTLLDERPHPNSMALLDHLNRDIAAGFEMSSDVLWNIAKLGGASVRYVLADAMTYIEGRQQLLVDQFLTRFWIYFCAVEMVAGRLAPCPDPEWYKVGWLPPAKLTVDLSRDGKLSIDLHRAGLLTAKRFYGMQGLDDEEEDAQRVEEYARRLVLCLETEARYRAAGHNIRIDPERVFPSAVPGAAGVNADPAAIPGAPASTDPGPASAFSSEEQWRYVEGSLDEILSHLRAA